MRHNDKPKHQRWIYHLSDYGLVKAILIIWGVCWATLVVAFAILKLILGHAK